MNERAERQAFERWAKMPPREWDVTRWPDDDRYSPYPNEYLDPATQRAWEAFKFAREPKGEALHEYAEQEID